MGTRSLTRIVDDGKEICCIYRQFYGYPSGHGAELAEFILSGRFVNGIPVGDTGRMFNGMGCFAAQLIAHLKQDAGGIYIKAPGTTDCWEEFVYVVRGHQEQEPTIECYDDEANTPLFNGTPSEFRVFCAKESEES